MQEAAVTSNELATQKAAVKTMQKALVKYYLEGAEFTIVTDLEPNTYLDKASSLHTAQRPQGREYMPPLDAVSCDPADGI